MDNTDSYFPEYRKLVIYLNRVKWEPSIWVMVVITVCSIVQGRVVRFWPYVFIPLLACFITLLHLACKEAMKNSDESHYNSISLLSEFFEFPVWVIICISNSIILTIYYQIADAIAAAIAK